VELLGTKHGVVCLPSYEKLWKYKIIFIGSSFLLITVELLSVILNVETITGRWIDIELCIPYLNQLRLRPMDRQPAQCGLQQSSRMLCGGFYPGRYRVR
jgi:hypothetical protein